MHRTLTSSSTLEGLKREAKRWLKALRADDRMARARLERANPRAPAQPGLRDVQHALAREHGLAGWIALRSALADRRAKPDGTSREAAVEALLAAANAGDIGRVGALLDEHPEIVSERATLPGHTGARTALHFAIDGPHEDVVALLLERGADPNVRDGGDDAMPLHFAAEKEHLGIIRLLIEHGADPVGEGTHHELDVLGWATVFGTGRREIVDYLLAHGARYTIFSAVVMGEAEVVRALVAASPALLAQRMDGTNRRRTPLHLAVVKKQPAVLAALLDLGADVAARDAAGLMPLDQAAVYGETEMARLLLERGATLELPAAVALQRTTDIERLLRDEPDALRPGGRWDKLIVRAAERAPRSLIETLIRSGASVHVRDDSRTSVDRTHGYTALHAAAFHGNLDAARALLRHGADPAAREDKYWGTPAGWAHYAGHADVRDLILEGQIDIFDAIAFDRADRVASLLARDPVALDRRFGEHVTGESTPRPWLDPAWTPIAFAAANEKLEAVRILADRGADLSVRDSAGRTLIEMAKEKGLEQIIELLEQRGKSTPPRTHANDGLEGRIAGFLRMACLDWRVGGAPRTMRMHDAGRLLERNPKIARASIHTAVACGELEEVRRLLDERPELVNELDGPRSWPPILYLCSARLPSPRSSEDAPAIARLLLDHGADPNAFYLGGNADIHYTALTCVLGRGEEVASMHPQARELTRLLLERGADPHDNQVLYNVFADNTSRRLLGDDVRWLLELMYEHSLRRGQEAQWQDPTWPMFDMRGAASLGDESRRHHGAHFMLEAAVDRNVLALGEWMLAHGAGPNTPWGTHPTTPRTLYQEALIRGHTEMAQLLLRYGAAPTPVVLDGYDAFVAACLGMDRQQLSALATRHPEYLTEPRALFMAARRDRADVVEMLLDLGVSPDLSDVKHGGIRALHVAAGAGAERVAALLIERGAEVDARETTYGGVPLGFAAWSQEPRTIALLGRVSRDVWNLVFTGNIERLREVLRAEPDRATVVANGETPLMWLPDDEACAMEIAELLLAHGADPTLRQKDGATAADLAGRRGLVDVAELLRAV